MDIEEKIEFYLSNEDVLYKDWYKKQNEYETGIDFGEPVGSYSEYKEAFDIWLKENKSRLQQKICPHKNEFMNLTKPSEIITLIISLIDEIAIIGAVIQVAVLIFNYGLENFCESFDE